MKYTNTSNAQATTTASSALVRVNARYYTAFIYGYITFIRYMLQQFRNRKDASALTAVIILSYLLSSVFHPPPKSFNARPNQSTTTTLFWFIPLQSKYSAPIHGTQKERTAGVSGEARRAICHFQYVAQKGNTVCLVRRSKLNDHSGGIVISLSKQNGRFHAAFSSCYAEQGPAYTEVEHRLLNGLELGGFKYCKPRPKRIKRE